VASTRLTLALVLTFAGCSATYGPVPTAPIGLNALLSVTGAKVRFYPVKPRAAGVLYIAAGPDGALWFTEAEASRIGRITTSGKQSSYPTKTKSVAPAEIAAGPDKALWFTQTQFKWAIGRITTAGHITEYPVSHPPYAIAKGPDGALWFTENEDGANWIGRMTTAGKVTEFKVPSKNDIAESGITTGPDRALWFTQFSTNQIGRITTSGKVRLFKNTDGDDEPQPIVSHGGELWFGESDGVGEVTTSGHFTEHAVPVSESGAITAMTVGPDHNIWFATNEESEIGTIAGGKLNEYTTGPLTRGMWGIALGSDKALWFTEVNQNRIGRFAP
jgi:virginiamycin B lyase